MKKCKAILPGLLLLLCVSAFFFPATAYAQVNDTTPPTLTATLSGDTLTATAKDEDTGVAAIFVGAHEFSTLADGVATLPFKEYASVTEQKVEVYAVDVAGNRSESVYIDNPWYVAPASSLPMSAPSSTPAPVQAPAPSPASTTAPDPLPAPSSVASSSSSASASATSLPEAQPPTSSAIPGTANLLTPDGGGTVQDSATEEDGKEFFTVTTAAGNIYYLVVDRQRGTENVYFLSPVTEDDLLGLTEDSPAREPVQAQPQPTPPASVSEPQPQADKTPQSTEMGIGGLVFILLAVAAIGGAGYYLKVVRPRKQAAVDTEEFGEEAEEVDEDEDEAFFDGESNVQGADIEEE